MLQLHQKISPLVNEPLSNDENTNVTESSNIETKSIYNIFFWYNEPLSLTKIICLSENRLGEIPTKSGEYTLNEIPLTKSIFSKAVVPTFLTSVVKPNLSPINAAYYSFHFKIS